MSAKMALVHAYRADLREAKQMAEWALSVLSEMVPTNDMIAAGAAEHVQTPEGIRFNPTRVFRAMLTSARPEEA